MLEVSGDNSTIEPGINFPVQKTISRLSTVASA
jgi:hypothetical protein